MFEWKRHQPIGTDWHIDSTSIKTDQQDYMLHLAYKKHLSGVVCNCQFTTTEYTINQKGDNIAPTLTIKNVVRPFLFHANNESDARIKCLETLKGWAEINVPYNPEIGEILNALNKISPTELLIDNIRHNNTTRNPAIHATVYDFTGPIEIMGLYVNLTTVKQDSVSKNEIPDNTRLTATEIQIIVHDNGPITTTLSATAAVDDKLIQIGVTSLKPYENIQTAPDSIKLLLQKANQT